MNNLFSNKKRIFILLFYLFIANFLLVPAFHILNINTNIIDSKNLALITIVTAIIRTLPILLLSYKFLVKQFKDFITIFKSKPFKTILCFVQFYILYFIISLVVSLIFQNIGIVPQESMNNQLLGSFQKDYPIIVFMASVIIAPIEEEIVFRESIFKITKLPTFLAGILSILIFTAPHIIDEIVKYGFTLQTLSYAYPYLIMSLNFVLIYHYKKNIYFPIILHFINNLIAFSILNLI